MNIILQKYEFELKNLLLFNETLQNNLNYLNIERKVRDIGDNFTKDFYTTLIKDILKEIKIL